MLSFNLLYEKWDHIELYASLRFRGQAQPKLKHKQALSFTIRTMLVGHQQHPMAQYFKTNSTGFIQVNWIFFRDLDQLNHGKTNPHGLFMQEEFFLKCRAKVFFFSVHSEFCRIHNCGHFFYKI